MPLQAQTYEGLQKRLGELISVLVRIGLVPGADAYTEHFPLAREYEEAGFEVLTIGQQSCVTGPVSEHPDIVSDVLESGGHLIDSESRSIRFFAGWRGAVTRS
jgi:hypothetical protein